MTDAPRTCAAVDRWGTRCGLPAGHAGHHQVVPEPTSPFAKVVVVPVLVMATALLIGVQLEGWMAPALGIGAVLAIAWVVASRR